jgi:hypothetical protein
MEKMPPHQTKKSDNYIESKCSALSTNSVRQSSISSIERERKIFRPFDIRVSTEQYNSIVSATENVGCSSSDTTYNNISLSRSNSILDAVELSKTNVEQLFFGAYGHLRKKLDYSYHSYYRKERQWLHDSIIEDFLEYQDDDIACDCSKEGTLNIKNTSQSRTRSETRFNPWLILSVGVQGAGKHYTINNLVRNKRLRLRSFINVAPGT